MPEPKKLKLRVKADATKGHYGRDGKLYGPGQELPGDYEAVPLGMAYKLEATDAKREDEGPVAAQMVDGPIVYEAPEEGQQQQHAGVLPPLPPGTPTKPELAGRLRSRQQSEAKEQERVAQERGEAEAGKESSASTPSKESKETSSSRSRSL